STYGRYGADRQPGTANSSVNPPTWDPTNPNYNAATGPRFYSAMDTDGTKAGTPNYYPSDALMLPGSNPSAPATFAFPFFPGSYSNADAYERLNHPLLSGYFQQTGDDRL